MLVARAWKEREARLKCRGLPLSKWFPLPPSEHCCYSLNLPGNWMGTLARPARTYH
ncbi:hypothetical protein [Pseudomonas chlororaphis]|uniref:hypothetical protein n=1 Tax=Pseudomonas chlororaphis TaxID=587753 RepID=UPI0015DE9B5F|nr:hypothetical protein [Pseudomonas chlororaphis]QLL12299.1 hypothetical protein H0I86_25345 [Pseudomonas chlororaphis subsp. aurantiaca]